MARRRRDLTEFIDMYPSLCELAGIPLPTHLHGRSFVPLMKEPSQPWKDAAIGRFESGDTIRTDTLRFSEYTDSKGEFVARMLYDHGRRSRRECERCGKRRTERGSHEIGRTTTPAAWVVMTSDPTEERDWPVVATTHPRGTLMLPDQS